MSPHRWRKHYRGGYPKLELLPKPVVSDAPPKIWPGSHPNADPCISLWAQVVIQALTDIEKEPMTSWAYLDAVDFFEAGGAWKSARDAIATVLGIEPEYMVRRGARAIAKRRAAEKR